MNKSAFFSEWGVELKLKISCKYVPDAIRYSFLSFLNHHLKNDISKLTWRLDHSN